MKIIKNNQNQNKVRIENLREHIRAEALLGTRGCSRSIADWSDAATATITRLGDINAKQVRGQESQKNTFKLPPLVVG